MSHSHQFDEAAWPFDTPINTAAFTTTNVLGGSHPILEVYHDHDGDWQFMCGATTASADAKVVCLGCMIDRDTSLMQLADLPEGWLAHRDSPAAPWSREEYEDSDADDEA